MNAISRSHEQCLNFRGRQAIRPPSTSFTETCIQRRAVTSTHLIHPSVACPSSCMMMPFQSANEIRGVFWPSRSGWAGVADVNFMRAKSRVEVPQSKPTESPACICTRVYVLRQDCLKDLSRIRGMIQMKCAISWQGICLVVRPHPVEKLHFLRNLHSSFRLSDLSIVH